MATLLNADLPSDDEDDETFEPGKAPGGGGGGGKGGGRGAGKGAKRGFMEVSDGDDDADNDDDGGAATAAPAKKSKLGKKAQRAESEAMAAVRSAKQSAKVDAVWALLKQGRTGSNGTAAAEPSPSQAPAGSNDSAPAEQAAQPSVGGAQDGGEAGPQTAAGKAPRPPAKKPFSLASVCRPVKKIDKRGDDTAWMKALGISKSSTSAGTTKKVAGGASEGVKAAAEAALAAAKAAASVRAAQEHGTVTVTETRRFAGKDVQMQRTLAASEAKKEAQKQAATGLDAMLEAMRGAKKVNVLDKSRADWGEVKKDSQVEAELEDYKKSGDKYLDRVDFLKRAELRQYEKERDERLGADIRTRGRL